MRIADLSMWIGNISVVIECLKTVTKSCQELCISFLIKLLGLNVVGENRGLRLFIATS